MEITDDERRQILSLLAEATFSLAEGHDWTALGAARRAFWKLQKASDDTFTKDREALAWDKTDLGA